MAQVDYADVIITNCQRLIVMVQVHLSNPTPANLDSLVSAIQNSTSTDIPRPQPDVNVDGESYNWSAYLQTLTSMIEKWIELRQILGGPFEIRVHSGR